MNVARNFLLIGVLYLLVGLLIGMYMGGSGDRAMTAAHAHMNLVGFTLMVVFALSYRLFPAMAEGGLAKAHFWLHQFGALVMSVGLVLITGGILPEETVGPIMPVGEIAVVIGVALFGWNALKNAT